jgi:exo-beta-1,3-glucanase (GH17 family)
VTEIVYVTETATQVFVYVDQDGVPYSTSTEGRTSSKVVESVATTPTVEPSSTSEAVFSSALPAPEVPAPSATPAPSVATTPEAKSTTVVEAPTAKPVTSATAIEPPSISPPPPPAPTTQEPEPEPEPEPEQSYGPPAAPTTQAPAPEPSAPAALPAPPSAEAPVPSSAAAPAQPAKPYGSGNVPRDSLPVGITYDPFAGSQGNSRCKTEQEVADEFEKMKDYKVVRIYGMGCDIVSLAVKNAVRNSQQIMAGAYLSNRGGGEDLSKVIKAFKSAIDEHAGGNWDMIKLFSVENERINDHDMTASEVVDAIKRARDQLRELGYNGPVGAVDTVPATVDNPAICKASDVVMVNCHAFFDPNTEASDAGSFVKSQIEQVKSACGTDRVVVTETGWPHQGSANGKAIPSAKNQQAALASLRSEFDHDMFLFNAFDSPWKSDWASSFDAERYWGIL